MGDLAGLFGLAPQDKPPPPPLGAYIGAQGGESTAPVGPPVPPGLRHQPAAPDDTDTSWWGAIKGAFQKTAEDISGGQQKTSPRVAATSAATGLKGIPADLVGLMRYSPNVRMLDAIRQRIDPASPSFVDTLAAVPQSVEEEHQRQMEGQAIEHPAAQFTGQTAGMVGGSGAMIGGTGQALRTVPVIGQLASRFPQTLGRTVGALSGLLDQGALAAGGSPPDTSLPQAAAAGARAMASPQGLAMGAVGGLATGLGGSPRAEAAPAEAAPGPEAARPPTPAESVATALGSKPRLTAAEVSRILAEREAAGQAARAAAAQPAEGAVPPGPAQPAGGAGGGEPGAGAGRGPGAGPGAAAIPAGGPAGVPADAANLGRAPWPEGAPPPAERVAPATRSPNATRMEIIRDEDGTLRFVPAETPGGQNVAAESGAPDGTSGGGIPLPRTAGQQGAPDLGADGSRPRPLGAGEGGLDQQEVGAQAGPAQVGAPVRGSSTEAGFIGRGGAAQPPPVTFSDPAVEAKFQAGRQGLDTTRTLADRWRSLSDGLSRIGKALTMENPHVSAGAEDAPLREVLRQQRATVPVQMQDIGNFFKRGIQTLAEPQRDLFERKLLLDDVRADENRFGRDPTQALPNGLTWDEVDRAGPKVDAAVKADPAVQRALDTSRQFWGEKRDAYAKALNDLGLPSDWLYTYGDTYMHHAVMDRMNPPSNEPLPPGVMPARGWQKGRGPAPSGMDAEGQPVEGHQLNLNYAQGQLPVLTQMAVDTQRLRAIKAIDDQYGLAGDARDAALKGEVPAGYTAVDPYTRYRQLFVGDGLKERAISELAKEQVAHGLGVDEARAAAEQQADANATIVITRHVDAALKYQESMVKPGPVAQAFQTITNKMKVFDVAAPWRVPAFFARKFAGDTSKIILNAPGATENIPWATKQVLAYNTGKPVDPAFDSFRKLGGLPGTFFAQEAGIADAQRLAEVRGDNPLSIEAKKAAGLGGAYTRTFRRGTEFADSVPRASAFKYFLDKINASPDGTLGGPENYAASMKSEVDALPTPEEKAYWLANQAIGAYDMVPEAARMLRRGPVPFTSVQWTNLAGDIRSLRNQVQAPASVGNMATLAGKAGLPLARMGFMGLRAAKWLGLAYSYELAQSGSNKLFFSDEEDRLPDDVRNNPHLNLGQDAEGNDRYIRRTSLFAEARDWLGMGEVGYPAMHWLDQQHSALDAAGHIASGWVDHLYNSLSPLYKAVPEMWAGKSGYPSVTHPSQAQDRIQYLLQQLGVSPDLALAQGRPTIKGIEGPVGAAKSHVFSYSNPDVTAYYDTMANRERFLQSANLAPEQLAAGGVGEKERALRDYKLALAYGESKVAAAKLLQYATLGGTEKGMADAFQRLNPLGPIGKLDAEGRFRDYLGKGTSAEHKLDRAMAWWQTMQDQNSDFLDKNPSLAAAFDKATELYQDQQEKLKEGVADR